MIWRLLFANDRSLELDNVDIDDEYESQSDDETEDNGDDDDDEEEDEAKIIEAEMREELAALKAEADLPLEEILKAYPKRLLDQAESFQVLSTDTDEPPFKKHKTNNVTATGFLAGSNTLEITDYSIVKKVIKTGNYIQSDIFTVGGYQWAIEFYPQGRDYSSSHYISIGVRLINSTNVVQAMSTHRFKDWKTLTWSTNMDTNANTFSSSHTGCAYFRFIKAFETSSYLRNDTLVIKTNLWVANNISGNNSNQWNLANADRCFF